MPVSSVLGLFFGFWISTVLLLRPEIFMSFKSPGFHFHLFISPLTSFFIHGPYLSKPELWGSLKLPVHPHVSSCPEMDSSACSNPPCSLTSSPASRAGIPDLCAIWSRIVSGWSYIPNPAQLLVHAKCPANVQQMKGWRRLPYLRHSAPKSHESLLPVWPAAEAWWAASQLPLWVLPFLLPPT